MNIFTCGLFDFTEYFTKLFVDRRARFELCTVMFAIELMISVILPVLFIAKIQGTDFQHRVDNHISPVIIGYVNTPGDTLLSSGRGSGKSAVGKT